MGLRQTDRRSQLEGLLIAVNTGNIHTHTQRERERERERVVKHTNIRRL